MFTVTYVLATVEKKNFSLYVYYFVRICYCIKIVRIGGPSVMTLNFSSICSLILSKGPKLLNNLIERKSSYNGENPSCQLNWSTSALYSCWYVTILLFCFMLNATYCMLCCDIT